MKGCGKVLLIILGVIVGLIFLIFALAALIESGTRPVR